MGQRQFYLFWFLFIPILLFADSYIVNNVEKSERDITGSVNNIIDNHGRACAVLKINIPVSARFRGDIHGDIRKVGNEYTLHVSVESKVLTIYPDNAYPIEFEFSDYPCYPYESKQSYRVEIILLNDSKSHENFDFMSFAELLKFGESGNAEACYAIAGVYISGNRNQTINYKKGFEWMLRAANLNHVDAQCEVGKFYFNGTYVSKNLEEAYKWFNLAADNNNGNAQYMMALRYCSNIDEMTAQDASDAKYWLNKAIDNNFILAYGHLSLISFKEGREDDGIEYAKKLAYDGNSWGQLLLGLWYAQEGSANYDLVKSEFWLELAAEADVPQAQLELAKYYETNFGSGDKEKFVESKFWYSKAAEHGEQEALTAIKRFK